MFEEEAGRRVMLARERDVRERWGEKLAEDCAGIEVESKASMMDEREKGRSEGLDKSPESSELITT